MNRAQQEIILEGFSLYEQSEELKEAISVINKSLRRERTAERRIYGTGTIRRGKGKKKKSSTGIPEEGASIGFNDRTD